MTQILTDNKLEIKPLYTPSYWRQCRRKIEKDTIQAIRTIELSRKDLKNSVRKRMIRDAYQIRDEKIAEINQLEKEDNGKL